MKHRTAKLFFTGMIFFFGIQLMSIDLTAEDRIQIELYGGISYMGLKDFNLIPKAEQQFNDLYFIQHLLGMQGYFVNDLPKIYWAVPAGLRFRYRLSPKFSVSVSGERFSRKAEDVISGSFRYEQPGWWQGQTKSYDPYRLNLSGYSLLGGGHYHIPVGEATELEVGVAAGWAWAEFRTHSNWSHTVTYEDPYWELHTTDGGVLEGDGSGNGFTAEIGLRISRSLGRRLGFFVEAGGRFCRMNSLTGSGLETRIGIPGETRWDGTWAFKREEISMSWKEDVILVPTNYWEGWIETQRDRDFTLNLSGARLVIGIYFRL